jgi:quercetin dioxygenase-like cupin family protein
MGSYSQEKLLISGGNCMSNRIINVLGEAVEILVSSKSTNYTFCVGVQTSPPGGGPPPHKHEREEETFTVLEGEYEIFNDNRWIPLPKGEVHFSPRGTFHAFRNSGTTAGKMMFITNAGALDEYFELISTLSLPQDIDRITEISKHYGLFFMPPEGSHS